MKPSKVISPQTFDRDSEDVSGKGSPKPLEVKDLVWYSGFALPLGFVGIPIYLYAPDFYAVEYGLPLSLLSLVLLALRLFDAVQDPYIGLWSDRFAHLRGTISSISVMIMTLAFFLLFLPPFDPVTVGTSSTLGVFGLIVWFAVLTLAATTAFSALTVNHNALGALWSSHEDQKSRIVTYREFLGLVGLMIALVVPTVFQEFMGRQASFLYFGGLMLVVAVIATFLFQHWLSNNSDSINRSATAAPNNGVGTYWSTLFSKDGRIFQIYALSVLASAFPAVLVLMFVRDYLQLETSFPLFMLGYVLAGIVFMPVWKRLGSSLGLTRAWMVSMLVGIAAFAWVTSISAGDQIQFLIICIATGAVFGADIVIPQTLISVRVHETSSKDGLQASSLFALLAFLGKTALALATGSSLLFLDLGGFVPDGNNTDSSLFVLLLFYALIPCVLKLAAAFLLFTLDRNTKIHLTQGVSSET